MKKTLSIFALFLAFSFLGTTKVNAETYLVNLDGSKGCGQYCDQLNTYLASQNTNTNNTSTSSPSGSNGSVQQPGQGNSTSYPYQAYVNFPSTDAYYKAASNSAVGKNANGQYPYPMYNYFQNPNPNPSSAMVNGVYQSYPTPIYTYYGGKGSTTKYTQPSSTAVNPSSGFVLTSIR